MKKALLCSALLGMPVVGMAEEVMIVTTDSLPGKTCTVVHNLPAISQRDIAAVSFKDPTLNAVVEAMKGLSQVAANVHANAVLGLTVDFTPRTERDTGKVVLTGTLARCD